MRKGYEPGDVIDDAYEVVERIGEGGFGEVYRVRQLSMDRDVAMKILLEPSDEEFAGRFRREVHAVRNLSHPNTVQLYDFAEVDDGHLYYTMEYLEGDTLVEKIQDSGAFGLVETRDILVQVLKSLGEAHSRGIVHRDLKPGNVMLADVYGEKNFVKVLDFGIAKAADSVPTSEIPDETLTSSENLVGTLRYMAPEQATDDPVGPHSDLFMVGLVAREMITAEKLHAGASEVRLLKERLDAEPVDLPSHLQDHPLGEVLGTALCKDHEERYQRAEAMREALEEIPEEVLRDAELPEVEPMTPISDLDSSDVEMEASSDPGDETVDEADIGEAEELGGANSRPTHSTRPPPGADESSRNDSPTTGQLSGGLPSPEELEEADEGNAREEPVEEKAVPGPSDLEGIDPDGETIEQQQVPAMVADKAAREAGDGDAPGGPPPSPDAVTSTEDGSAGDSGLVPGPPGDAEDVTADDSGLVPGPPDDAADAPSPSEHETNSRTAEEAGADAEEPSEEDEVALRDAAGLAPFGQQLDDLFGWITGRPERLYTAGGSAAVVLGLVGWLGFVGSGGEAGAGTKGTGAEDSSGAVVFGDDAGAASEDATGEEMASVRIESPQSGVEGRVDGEAVGTTPFELEVDRETTIELAYEGTTKRIALGPDSPSVREVVFRTADAGEDVETDTDAGPPDAEADVGDDTAGGGRPSGTGPEGATAERSHDESAGGGGPGPAGGSPAGTTDDSDEPSESPDDDGESTQVPIFE